MKDIEGESKPNFSEIDGLCFESNEVLKKSTDGLYIDKKLLPSNHRLPADFITHSEDFSYPTYGIHIGQKDRLTFIAPSEKPILGHFLDCRKGSKTYRKNLSIRFSTSLGRKLIIPCGVAHTFDNLQSVITRNEPILYSTFHNTDWKPDSDVLMVERNATIDEFPSIDANIYQLPTEAHIMLCKFRQKSMATKSLATHSQKIKIGNKEKIIQLKKSDWIDDTALDSQTLQSSMILENSIGSSTSTRIRNSFSVVSKNSWNLIPSYDNCYTEIYSINPSIDFAQFALHTRQNTAFTILHPSNEIVKFEIIDLRKSANIRNFEKIEFHADPRYRMTIPAGVAYRIRANSKVLARVEFEILVDENEPRNDLPWYNEDLKMIDAGKTKHFERITPPNLVCPDTIIWKLAERPDLA